ncbi:MAG: hypothetical protein DRQ98_00585 [Gammaproteobacteria bacterium]|nr:MAG: hypothetical protein DRQ98_00585 [Gammaproteobacteria bacterium]
MLCQHQKEFYWGGTLVERYRLVHNFYLTDPRLIPDEAEDEIARYLTNELPDYVGHADKIASALNEVRPVFHDFVFESGLDIRSFLEQIDLLHPDQVLTVEKWWKNKPQR